MSNMTWDWSPVLQAIQGYGQQYKYNKMVDSLLGGTQGSPGAPAAPVAPAQIPLPQNVGLPQSTNLDASMPAIPSLAGTPSPLGPQAANILPMLKGMDPSVGMPLLLKMATTQNEYDTTPRYDQQGNAYVMSKTGQIKYLDGVKERTKAEFVNGQAVDPYNTAPGTVISPPHDYNKPFDPATGSANTNYQGYERSLEQTKQAPAWANVGISQQRLAFEKQKLDAGIPDEATLHDMATRYVNGDKSVATGMSRNAQMQTAFQHMISQVGKERGLSPEQISHNQQTFQAGTKAVQAFDTGKQGDTTRSLNVSVAHLNTLKELGTALQNGNVSLINAAKQKFAEQFGVPAPTNFDAARAIVADEVAKGVIGGQTAQADREALAASLQRNRSPQAINGAINTFQNLLAGQLHGLRQQYKSSTGRDDFNDKLFPETISVLEGAHPRTTASPSGWAIKLKAN